MCGGPRNGGNGLKRRLQSFYWQNENSVLGRSWYAQKSRGELVHDFASLVPRGHNQYHTSVRPGLLHCQINHPRANAPSECIARDGRKHNGVADTPIRYEP